jgi:integrase
MQIPPDDLMAGTVKAYGELEKENPKLWLAATLALMFGMRPTADGARAEWSWFVQRGGAWWLEYTPSKTRGRTTEGSAVVQIRLPEGLWERMRAANPRPGYVVPGECVKHRVDVFKRDLCAWQRGNGWDRARYCKPAYMLRKLCASAVARATGGNVQAAASMLGITVATVIKHYAADFRRQSAAVDVAGVIEGSTRTAVG